MNHQIKKMYGQNFLKSESILRKIIESSGVNTNDHVIEIGPGRGALTALLVKNSLTVDAFEIDETLRSYLLPIEVNNPNLKVYYEDILDVDLDQFLTGKGLDKAKVIANIPYYITSPIIFKLLESAKITDATILIQKEVANRISSKPNSKEYGSITVLIQFEADVTKCVQVKNTMFYPVPKVDSTVIKLSKHNRYKDLVNDETQFRTLVKESFKQKRKTLLNNLESYSGLNKTALLEKLQIIDSKYTAFTRAESMTIEDFIKLSNGW